MSTSSHMPCITILALQLIGIITTRWSSAVANDSNSTQTFHMGLWKNCTDTQIGSDHNSITIHTPDESDVKFNKNSLYAVRAFAILGLLCLFLQGYVHYLKLFGKSTTMVRKQLYIFGGIFSILASIIWMNEFTKIPEAGGGSQPKYIDASYGYSLYVTLFAGMLSLFSAYKL
jgi:hypothetical protein